MHPLTTTWCLMTRRFLILLPLLALPAAVTAQTVDTTGAGAIVAQAMDHSEVMANLRELSDVIGPRLTGSTAMRRANEKDLAALRTRLERGADT